MELLGELEVRRAHAASRPPFSGARGPGSGSPCGSAPAGLELPQLGGKSGRRRGAGSATGAMRGAIGLVASPRRARPGPRATEGSRCGGLSRRRGGGRGRTGVGVRGGDAGRGGGVGAALTGRGGAPRCAEGHLGERDRVQLAEQQRDPEDGVHLSGIALGEVGQRARPVEVAHRPCLLRGEAEIRQRVSGPPAHDRPLAHVHQPRLELGQWHATDDLGEQTPPISEWDDLARRQLERLEAEASPRRQVGVEQDVGRALRERREDQPGVDAPRVKRAASTSLPYLRASRLRARDLLLGGEPLRERGTDRWLPRRGWTPPTRGFRAACRASWCGPRGRRRRDRSLRRVPPGRRPERVGLRELGAEDAEGRGERRRPRARWWLRRAGRARARRALPRPRLVVLEQRRRAGRGRRPAGRLENRLERSGSEHRRSRNVPGGRPACCRRAGCLENRLEGRGSEHWRPRHAPGGRPGPFGRDGRDRLGEDRRCFGRARFRGGGLDRGGGEDRGGGLPAGARVAAPCTPGGGAAGSTGADERTGGAESPVGARVAVAGGASRSRRPVWSARARPRSAPAGLRRPARRSPPRPGLRPPDRRRRAGPPCGSRRPRGGGGRSREAPGTGRAGRTARRRSRPGAGPAAPRPRSGARRWTARWARTPSLPGSGRRSACPGHLGHS